MHVPALDDHGDNCCLSLRRLFTSNQTDPVDHSAKHTVKDTFVRPVVFKYLFAHNHDSRIMMIFPSRLDLVATSPQVQLRKSLIPLPLIPGPCPRSMQSMTS